MACVALISLMRTLELEFLEPHPRVVLRKTKEIKSLLEKLAVVQSLLEQSEEKLGVSQQAAAMEHLAAKVRDIAFKGEEDIESQVIEIVCAEKKSNLLLARLLYDTFQCVAEIVCAREKTSPYARLYDMFQSVADEIEEVVECIKKTMAQLELDTDTPLTVRDCENITLAGSPGRRHTSELEPDDDEEEEDIIMVGRAKELTQIREMLLQCSSSSSQERRQVMSIVGMGGIGKTTFATSIYNDPSIQDHFDLLGWTTVSNDHSLRKVLCDLCRSVMQMPEDEILMASDADIAKRLRQRLIGQRYLIVVDDIWSARAWDDVQRCFPEDFNGSRILLTTRLKEVVDYTGSSGKYVLNLPFLNSDESWKLFYEKVSSEEEEERLPLELEEVGKRIVRKCNGLPLALVVVAGHLSKTNKSLEKWESIASMINLQVTSDFHEQCSNILTFSYNNLPYPLKACFLYFGVFPEDSEILVKDLIRLWIAEGFIKVDSSQRNLEVAELVAKDHLQDLIDRNLVLIGKQSWGGNMKTCRVHDLLYDLCLRETKNHKLVSTIQSDCSSANTCRWLRVQFSNRFFIQSSLYSNQTFNTSRTISSFSSHHPRAFFYDYSFLNNHTFKMLRVLDLRSIAFNYVPQFDITDLVLLRYLGLDSIKFIKVMEHRSNLQTLIVNRGRTGNMDDAASEWLLGIWKSQKLRHVKFPHPFPEEDLVQDHLLTVCWLPDFQCTKEFFLRIPNVKSLGIRCGFNDWQCNGVSWWHNLHYLTNLQKLTVEYFSYTCLSYNTSCYLPSIYAFPRTIKSIKLVGTILPWRAITIISMLPNLEKLKISQANSMGEEWETSEGGFLRLKILFISGSILKHWYTRGDHFPVLERLSLHFCLFLEEIPTGFTDVLTLQFIELNKCHSSLVESARKIQVEQEDMYGRDDLVILDYNTWQQ